MVHSWRALFLSHLDEEVRPEFAALDDLEERLARLARDTNGTYAELPVEMSAFTRVIARRVEGTAPADELTGLHAPDLYLADACARGEDAALRIFDRYFGADIDRAIAKSPRLGLSPDEFRQLVRERLFVATDERRPRIAGYQGRGALRSWLRVTVTRLVVDIARRQKGTETPQDDELISRLPSTDDPELNYLRHAYANALPPAFERALAGLTIRQRNLLRQRFLHELTVERLATMYAVHRATMFEWLAKARQALLLGLREALAQQLPGHDLDSVVAALSSRFELSVRRMLDSRLEQETVR